jgi:ABC-type polysaccharide/polyol phosphate export permease
LIDTPSKAGGSLPTPQVTETPDSPGASLPRRQSRVIDTAIGSEATAAFHDLVDGISNWRLWSMIGWIEIRQRYRRSALGPFWLTISMAVTVLTLGLLYGNLFNIDIGTYIPFICLGMVCWDFISKTIIESCGAFLNLEHVIKQIRLPLTVHIASTLWRNLATLCHNISLIVVVALVFGIWPGVTGLLVFPGMALVVINLLWIALLLATICARFRDVPQIVATAVQLLFFVTPVLWKPDMLKNLSGVALLNPFFHLIELLRGPLLGQAPALLSWLVLTGTAIVGWTVTFAIFKRFRKRVPYWL